MAKLYEEIIVIKVSKLLRDSEADAELVNPETLEEIVQQLAGEGVLVEIEKS